MAAVMAVGAVLCAAPALGQQGDRVEGLLERLSNAAGPSGFEEPVRALMVGEMKGLTTGRSAMTGWGM